MNKELKRYLLIIGGGVVIMVLLILLVSSLFGGKKDTAKKPETPEKTLADYADTDATVSLRIRGIINGDEIHREIQITVGNSFRRVDIVQGYQNTVIKTQTLYNNEPAYNEFLSALNTFNFTKSIKNPASKNPEGACAFGNLYGYNLSQNSENITDLWASTCTSQGNSRGRTQQIVQLFQNQIPNYPDFTRDVQLNATSATGS